MFLRYEEKCPRCGCRFINIVDADTIYSKNYQKQRGKIVWYKCCDCNNVFGYYIIDDKDELKVVEISLNNS